MASPDTTPCPKCSSPSPLVDCCEVDIGVGIQTWDHEYECPTHGRFVFVVDKETFKARAVFQVDELEKGPP